MGWTNSDAHNIASVFRFTCAISMLFATIIDKLQIKKGYAGQSSSGLSVPSFVPWPYYSMGEITLFLGLPALPLCMLGFLSFCVLAL